MRSFDSALAVAAPQAGEPRHTYIRAVTPEGTMLYWLKRAAIELREQAERKQVHVAATMDADQSTIYRFEKEDGWSEYPDLTIAAYAEDLGISTVDLWSHALDLWRRSGAIATVADLQRHKRERAANRATAATAKARRASRARRRESDEGPEAKERPTR